MKTFKSIHPEAIATCSMQPHGFPAWVVKGMKRNVLLLAAIVACMGNSVGATPMPWGEAGSFAVLGGSGVTSVGLTVIDGDLGVSPGTVITGFGPGIVNGTTHQNDATAVQAHADATSVRDFLLTFPPDQNLTSTGVLGGLELNSGVYEFDAAADLTGTLTLNGPGTYIFLIGSTLTTAAQAKILGINGAKWEDVFFVVGSSATLGANTEFLGNIISQASDTLGTGASVNGRVIALTGAVTLSANSIVVPEPSPAVLLLAGGVLLFSGRRRAATVIAR